MDWVLAPFEPPPSDHAAPLRLVTAPDRDLLQLANALRRLSPCHAVIVTGRISARVWPLVWKFYNVSIIGILHQMVACDQASVVGGAEWWFGWGPICYSSLAPEDLGIPGKYNDRGCAMWRHRSPLATNSRSFLEAASFLSFKWCQTNIPGCAFQQRSSASFGIHCAAHNVRCY